MKKRGRPLSEKAIKAKKASYMKEYYRKKKYKKAEVSALNHIQEHVDFLKKSEPELGIEVKHNFKPHFQLTQGLWTISGHGSLQELQNLVNQLKGE